MVKKIFFITLIAMVAGMAFSVFAFAGEGSDTIGACRLMPELRYAYYYTPVNLTTHPPETVIVFEDDDWNVREHNLTLQVNYGITNNIDVYGFFGARIAVKRGEETIFIRRATERADEFDLGTGIMAGAGIKATFYRAPNGLYVGGGASFTYAFSNDDVHLRNYVGGTLVEDSGDAGIFYKEREMAATADLHAGWHFKEIGLTPYVGVEYRWVREDLVAEKLGEPNDFNNFSTAAKNPVGVFVGVDYTPDGNFFINLEGQMIKRWGGSVSIGYAFDLCGKPAPAPAPAPVAPPIEPKLEPMSKN